MTPPYTALVVSDPAGGYSAAVLEWPGCFAEGDTAEAALAALERAAAAWVEAARTQQQCIPPCLSLKEQTGRVLLRLPRSVHHRAVQRAAAEGISLNTWLVSVVALALGDTPPPQRRSRIRKPKESQP